MNLKPIFALFLASAALTQHAKAELQPRDFNADTQIDAYLDTQSMTLWYVNAGASGLRTFGSSQDWVEGLVVAGNTEWRLPSITELESLYATLISNYGSVSAGPFENVRLERYWSTTAAPSPLIGWNETLDMRNGLRFQHLPTSSITMNAWAVQSVPEPSAPLLFAIGAFAILIAARRARGEA